MTIRDVEEIEHLVHKLLSNSQPYGSPLSDDYNRWIARVHETTLYYAKLPYGLKLLRVKYGDHQFNKTLQATESDRAIIREKWRHVII